MDDRPFFEFNLFEFGESHVEELKKFTKAAFDLDTIISTASNLKYHKALIAEIRSEFEKPSDDLVKMLTTRVYAGRLTQPIRDQFADLTHRALRDFVRDRINERLKSALDTDRLDHTMIQDLPDDGPETPTGKADEIVTTPEEMEGYRIIQAIGAEIVDPERIVMRDAKSYCAILLDDNNRRPLARLHFGKKRMAVTIFVPDNETRFDVTKPAHLFQHRNEILAAIRQYDK